MSPCVALLGLQLRGVIDRVEGGMAVVEWAEGRFSDLPTALLPSDAREGDPVLVQIQIDRPMDAACAAPAQAWPPAGPRVSWPVGEATPSTAR